MGQLLLQILLALCFSQTIRAEDLSCAAKFGTADESAFSSPSQVRSQTQAQSQSQSQSQSQAPNQPQNQAQILWQELFMIQQLFPVPKGIFDRPQDRQTSALYRVVRESYAQKLNEFVQVRANKKRVLELYNPTFQTLETLLASDTAATLAELFQRLSLDAIRVKALQGNQPITLTLSMFVKKAPSSGAISGANQKGSTAFWYIESSANKNESLISSDLQALSQFIFGLSLRAALAFDHSLRGPIVHALGMSNETRFELFLTLDETLSLLNLNDYKLTQTHFGTRPSLIQSESSSTQLWRARKMQILIEFLDDQLRNSQEKKSNFLWFSMLNPQQLNPKEVPLWMSQYGEGLVIESVSGAKISRRWARFEAQLNKLGYYIKNEKVIQIKGGGQ